MPTKPGRPCKIVSCRHLRPCPVHVEQERVWVRKVDTRPSAARRGYGYEWQVYRRAYLSAHTVCVCGCGGVATEIDHVIPVNGPDDPLFWAESNHQAMTHECHSRKTKKENIPSPYRLNPRL